MGMEVRKFYFVSSAELVFDRYPAKLITINFSSYTGTDVVADVSYDMFTSSTSSGSTEFEIKV
jgi:hypothetical protein